MYHVRQSHADREWTSVGSYETPRQAYDAALASARSAGVSAWIGDGRDDVLRVYPDGGWRDLSVLTGRPEIASAIGD